MARRQTELEKLIATGDAYARVRDERALMGLLFAGVSAACAMTAAVYASASDHWTIGAIALIAASVVAAAAAAVAPWARLAHEWLLTLYWAAVAGIVAAVYVFDVPGVALLLLLPMMGLTYTFWRDRVVVGGHLAGAVVAFTLPVATGDMQDTVSAMMVTLPVIVMVAALSGVLSDRFHSMRRTERARYKATIEALSTALTARDGYTGSHSQETLWFVRAICDELGLTEHECEYVADVALLHDIGKIGIPNEVLHEPGKLNDDQWEVMKQHPEIGERIVKTVPGLEEVARAIRHEHEHWDGAGYPDGLQHGDIPLASRIVLVCDAFHAMTSDRPYRAAMSIGEARRELSQHAGTQFDPVVVGAMLHVLDRREPLAVHESGLRPAPEPRLAQTGA